MANVHSTDCELPCCAVEDDEPDFDVEVGPESFTLSIKIEGAELADDESDRAQALCRMLSVVASKVAGFQTEGIIKDISGNTVGRWELA